MSALLVVNFYFNNGMPFQMTAIKFCKKHKSLKKLWRIMFCDLMLTKWAKLEDCSICIFF